MLVYFFFRTTTEPPKQVSSCFIKKLKKIEEVNSFVDLPVNGQKMRSKKVFFLYGAF